MRSCISSRLMCAAVFLMATLWAISGSNPAKATTTTTRLLINGGTPVSYKRYSDSGRTVNWGNTVGTDTVASSGTGSTQNFTVYGRVPSQASVAPGTFTDTIMVTVSY